MDKLKDWGKTPGQAGVKLPGDRSRFHTPARDSCQAIPFRDERRAALETKGVRL